MVERVLGQVSESTHQANALSTSALARFADEGLVGEMPHVNFEVLNFIRQQEGVRHEAEVCREEALQSADDHAENVLLGEVLSELGQEKCLRPSEGTDLSWRCGP